MKINGNKNATSKDCRFKFDFIIYIKQLCDGYRNRQETQGVKVQLLTANERSMYIIIIYSGHI